MKLATRSVQGQESVCCVEVDTPLGCLRVTATDEGVTTVDWVMEPTDSIVEASEWVNSPVGEQPESPAAHFARRACAELEEYFHGVRKDFTVPVVLRGTEFQRSVWQALSGIPYGETRSYRDIAIAIGRNQAVRAVGQANRANPVPIIVPCHRVIGSGGGLVGYAGSQTQLKEGLLSLEKRYSEV